MQGVENLFDRMDRMATHDPTFCDITWGAGGTTADLTLEIASKMQNMVRDSITVHEGPSFGLQPQLRLPGSSYA